MERRKQQKPSVSAPPRTLDVSKFAETRASELESLHSVISSRLNNKFKSQRNKRRRTTSFDNRSKKQRSRKKHKLLDEENHDKKSPDMLPRKVRRRLQLRKNPVSGFCTSGDGTKRMPTHLWHAKRFTMAKNWGFYIPLGLPGRGKGSRALLKRFKNGALIHDTSYTSAVQLEGPEDSLLSILRTVLVPPPSPCPEELSACTLAGITHCSAMLHHVGAPFSQLICPIIYMWRPSGRHEMDTDARNSHIITGSLSPSSTLCHSSFRQLWLLIHGGALAEGLGALRFACQMQKDETGISINCFPLEGQLAKLEIMGAQATNILKKILVPAYEISVSSQVEKSFILENVMHLPDHAILSLVAKDPRDLPKKESKSILDPASNTSCGDAIEEESKDNSGIISSLWLNSEENNVHYSDSKDLWENLNAVNPPVEENLLCLEKHQKRMEFFHLDQDSKLPNTETKEPSSRSCPLLLLKKNNLRWAIILPLSWVKSFWLPLINNGAQAIGLRERRWIASDVQLPSFPHDFPDCKTYSSFMANEALSTDEKAQLRPLGMRPLKVPISPPWDTLRDTQDPKEDDPCFKGIIARTSGVLSIKDDTKPCFVRVVLRAFKEGSFEEGSVVCAPHLSDILQGQLQISESLVRSYFTERASGKWELQKPEDPVSKECFRWPLGFVTTGFVPGSTKPTAVAICDATLLAKLRKEQWEGKKEKQKKSDIYVLVRNLRSTAYRLGLASIVLEKQSEDMEFM